MSWLEPPPANGHAEVRSFASYTDSVTDEEMAFAGSDPFGIFSGGFNSASNGIAWGATAGSGDRQRDDRGRPRDELRGLWREALRHDV